MARLRLYVPLIMRSCIVPRAFRKPLSGARRERFVPHPDQWEFLSAIRKINRQELEEMVRHAERKGQIIGVRLAPESEEDEEPPWKRPPSGTRTNASIAGPLPQSLELILGDQIYIPKDALPPALRNRLIRLAAFQNPEFYKLQAMRLPTYDKPRIIACAEDHSKHLVLLCHKRAQAFFPLTRGRSLY